MAVIKHLCGVRVKLVHTNDRKQCEGCVFDRGPGNRCRAFWQCFDIISSGEYIKHEQWDNKNGACHWELAR